MSKSWARSTSAAMSMVAPPAATTGPIATGVSLAANLPQTLEVDRAVAKLLSVECVDGGLSLGEIVDAAKQSVELSLFGAEPESSCVVRLPRIHRPVLRGWNRVPAGTRDGQSPPPLEMIFVRAPRVPLRADADGYSGSVTADRQPADPGTKPRPASSGSD